MSWLDDIGSLFGGSDSSGGDYGMGDPGASGIGYGQLGTDVASPSAADAYDPGAAAGALSQAYEPAQSYPVDSSYGSNPQLSYDQADPSMVARNDASGQSYDQVAGQPGSGSGVRTVPGTDTSRGTGAKLLNGFGMNTTSDGTLDWTDPKTLTNLLKALGAGGTFLNSIINKGKAAGAQSASQLAAALPANINNNWNPTQQLRANQFFSQQYVPTQQRQAQVNGNPIVASRGYAEGGGVDDGFGGEDQLGALGQAAQQEQGQQGTPEGLVGGDSPGQADTVPVNLSGGEYIMPADVVSDLGDGNNAAGAKALDEWVQDIRKRSRSTGPEDNPPPAQSPAEYMGGDE